MNHVEVSDIPPTPEEAERRIKKAEELLGSPFERLPGDLPDHKVLKVIDGHKIHVSEVEMVWNDSKLMDHVMGQGYYRKRLELKSDWRSQIQIAVLDLAESLYGGASNGL